MKPYKPSSVELTVGGNTLKDFTEITEITIPDNTMDISLELEGIGKVKGYVYLTDEQFLKFNEKFKGE